jgi:hypothetical protein
LILFFGPCALEFSPVFRSSLYDPGGDIAAAARSKSGTAVLPDAADRFLSSAVRWFHGDSKRSK